MKCPSCSRRVPAGTEICPHCDYIIDPSFLGDVSSGQPASAGENTPAEGVEPLDFDEEETPSEGTGEDESEPDEVERELEQLRRRRIVKNDRPRAMRIGQREGQEQDAAGEALQDVAGYLQRVWNFFGALDRSQQLVLGGAAAVFVGLFLPWVSDTTKDYLGLEVDGLILMLLVAVAAVSIVLRSKSGHWAEPGRARSLLYAQLVASVLGTLFVLVQMSRPLALVDVDPRVPAEAVHANLQFGIVLSLAASAVVLAGSVMEFKKMISSGGSS
ncbi:MAG: hypothetical protein D6806_10240 [Deltaproteobacteria bacterium]|nr:MAG: hypothetical protein D6806_10240 [Deltaproteobacteria bacterium]